MNTRLDTLMVGVVAVLATSTAPIVPAAETAVATQPDGIPLHGSFSREPAKAWEHAFVTGNGRMGAMMFGNPTNDTIVANHCRLFAPLGNREIVPDLVKYVPELKQIIRGKGYDAAMNFFLGKAKEQGFPGIIPTDPYHPGFFVNVHQKPDGSVSDYVRTENFQNGEVQVRWRDARGLFSRRLFVSRTANLIVLSLNGPKAGALDCDLEFPSPSSNLVRPQQQTSAEWVTYHSTYSKGKGGFDAAVRIIAKGGKAQAEGNLVKVSGADEVLLLMRIVPWKTPLPKDRSEAWAYSTENPDFAPDHLGIFKPVPALAESSVVAYRTAEDASALMPKLKESLRGVRGNYAALLTPHAKAHGALFNRVTLDLGGGAGLEKTTEALLDAARTEKRLSAALMEKMYDAGRYMVICSAGELPPNLQGIWTGTWRPAWSGDFTLDTNVQAAMASALSANLPELMEGYFRMIESFYPEWTLNAKRSYGCRGYFSNPRASNTCLFLHWGDWEGIFWTAGAGWLASFFQDYYLYTEDREFLAKRCVPLFKGIAAFYEDFLSETDKAGHVIFIPSYNPETGCGTNATMDIAVTREVLRNLLAAPKELRTAGGASVATAEQIHQWQTLLAKLPSYPIDDRGQLAEWPGGGVSPGHRHHSMLYPCFQSFDPIFETTPALWRAAQATVRAKIAGSDGGGEQSSFGRVQSGVSAAFLRMPEEAYGRLKVMAEKRSMYPSLITSHEPNADIYNTDGNGGIPQIVNTMLAFSQPGRLDLLPALPAEWPRGEIRGTLARGQVTINRLAWDKPGAKLTLELTSGKAQTVTLCLPNAAAINSITARGASAKESAKGPNYRELSLKAKAPAKFEITFSDMKN